MDITLTLAGVVLGSGATLAGQLLVRSREERERWIGIMLDACANIYMLEDEFLASAGLHRPPPYFAGERYERWSRRDRALAGARLRLVTESPELLGLESQLRESGRRLWHFAHSGGADAEEADLALLLHAHRLVLESFVATSQRTMRFTRRRPSLSDRM